MSKTLDIVMQLKDNVSPNLGKMNSNLQATSGKLNAVGKSVGKLGSLLKGALVGGAITKFASDAMQAYDTQIQAEKSVQRALMSTGKTATEAAQGLDEYKKFASQQQDLTAFGDEATLKVISDLISQGFGKKSIEGIVAMSQDIARSTGDEQENVTKALAAYIKTGKGATKLAKAYKLNADLLGKGSTESERQAEVWEALSKSGHLGAASDYMKTFTGQLEGAKGRLADMIEPAGQLAFQLLGVGENGKQLQDIIVDMTNDLQKMADRSKELGGGVLGIGQACTEAHPIISTFFAVLVAGKTITAIASLASTFGTAYSAVTTFGGSVLSVATKAIPALLGSLAPAEATFATFCGFLASTTALIIGVTSAATAAATAIAELLGNIGGYMSASPELRAQLQADQEAANGAFASTPGMYDYHPSIFDKANANGTNYFEGGPTLVGEYGPELVNLPRGSSINTNAQTQREFSGFGDALKSVFDSSTNTQTQRESSESRTTINCPVTVQGNVIGNTDFIDQVGDAISSRVSLAIANM